MNFFPNKQIWMQTWPFDLVLSIHSSRVILRIENSQIWQRTDQLFFRAHKQTAMTKIKQKKIECSCVGKIILFFNFNLDWKKLKVIWAETSRPNQNIACVLNYICSRCPLHSRMDWFRKWKDGTNKNYDN